MLFSLFLTCSKPLFFSLAIKAEPVDDYQLNPYTRSDNQSLSGMSMKSLCHQLEQEINPQALNVSPTMYHLTTADPRGHMFTPESFDEPAYYQSRAGALINSSMMYHTANHMYSNSSAALLSHSAPTPCQCVNAKTLMAKLGEGPQVGDSFEACLMSRHQAFAQTSLPLGRSPPSRYIQVKAGSQMEPSGQPLPQIGSVKGNHNEKAPEGIRVKQENLSYTYLEDGEF